MCSYFNVFGAFFWCSGSAHCIPQLQWTYTTLFPILVHVLIESLAPKMARVTKNYENIGKDKEKTRKNIV